MKIRQIICIKPRDGKACGNHLGDIEADKEITTNFRPCAQCHVEWQVSQGASGLLTYKKLHKGLVKDYDRDTLMVEEIADATG